MYFQSIRIIPIDWKQSLGLKVSVRGCDTQMPSKYFDGDTTIPVTNLDINETLDIKIGFKTFESNGILLRYVIKIIDLKKYTLPEELLKSYLFENMHMPSDLADFFEYFKASN